MGVGGFDGMMSNKSKLGREVGGAVWAVGGGGVGGSGGGFVGMMSNKGKV